jgi:hypothetical protein
MIIGVAVVVIVAAYLMITSAPGDYDSFAQCVGASGAKMYGATWCPHCNDQKHEFGNSFRFIQYVECSTPDNSGESDECRAANITAYPTWVFGDGTRETGALSFEEIAARTSCAIGK